MTVSEQIIEVLNFLGQKFGIAIDWTNESVVPAIQNLMSKYIKYEMWTSIFWVVFNLAVIVAYFSIVALCVKNWSKICDECWDDGAIAGLSVGFIIPAICTVFAVCEATDIIKCVIFPEMQIAEYLASLMGKG